MSLPLATGTLNHVYEYLHASVRVLFSHNTQVFEALCRVSADSDAGVKNASQLLDRLLKDVVSESTQFPVDSFVPLLCQVHPHLPPLSHHATNSHLTTLSVLCVCARTHT